MNQKEKERISQIVSSRLELFIISAILFVLTSFAENNPEKLDIPAQTLIGFSILKFLIGVSGIFIMAETAHKIVRISEKV